MEQRHAHVPGCRRLLSIGKDSRASGRPGYDGQWKGFTAGVRRTILTDVIDILNGDTYFFSDLTDWSGSRMNVMMTLCGEISPVSGRMFQIEYNFNFMKKANLNIEDR